MHAHDAAITAHTHTHTHGTVPHMRYGSSTWPCVCTHWTISGAAAYQHRAATAGSGYYPRQLHSISLSIGYGHNTPQYVLIGSTVTIHHTISWHRVQLQCTYCTTHHLLVESTQYTILLLGSMDSRNTPTYTCTVHIPPGRKYSHKTLYYVHIHTCIPPGRK